MRDCTASRVLRKYSCCNCMCGEEKIEAHRVIFGTGGDGPESPDIHELYRVSSHKYEILSFCDDFIQKVTVLMDR